jgi:hypothetical protein
METSFAEIARDDLVALLEPGRRSSSPPAAN